MLELLIALLSLLLLHELDVPFLADMCAPAIECCGQVYLVVL
jgi:hypothetical protein